MLDGGLILQLMWLQHNGTPAHFSLTVHETFEQALSGLLNG
jgi:hypothetical protein